MPSATHAPGMISQTRQIPALPGDLLAVAESQWLFSEAELLLAPSIVEGKLSPEKERENRCKGVNFILQAGIMLKLPQITLATASVFLHRFYMRHSMIDVPGKLPGYHYYSMAATCLFLATKVEENCRKMKELVVACVRVAQKDPNKFVDEQDAEYWKWRDNILHSEDVLLEALCFDLSLEAPYKILFELLIHIHHENHKRLRNAAWAFVNDSCLTMLCLLFCSRTIAASAVYAAASYTGVTFPDDQTGRPWWESAGVDIREVRRACNYMAALYENAPTRSGREGIVYERTPEGVDDWEDRTRDPESKRHDGKDQNGPATDVLHDRHRKAGDDRDQERIHINEAANDTDAVHQTVGNGASPRKRVKVQGNDQLSNENPRYDISINSRQSLEKQIEGVEHPLEPSKNNSVPNVGKMDSSNGLVSPRLDEVSEEGEVET